MHLIKKFQTSSELIGDGKLYPNIERISNNSQLIIHDRISIIDKEIKLIEVFETEELMYVDLNIHCYV